MRKSIFITLSFFLTGILFSQKSIYLGFEGGPSFDKYSFFDNGDQILSLPLSSWSYGINFSYDLNNFFSVETGAIVKDYKRGNGFRGIGEGVGFNAGGINTVQIPLRLRTRIPLIKDRLFFSTVMGYHHSFNLFNTISSGSVGASGGNFILDSDEIFKGNLVKSFSLLETGAGLELRVLKTAYLRFSASYFTGFKKVSQSDIVYTVNDGPATRATIQSSGSYLSYTMSIRFPIASIRPKKK